MTRRNLVRGSLTALGLATAAGLVLAPAFAAGPVAGDGAVGDESPGSQPPSYNSLPLQLTLTGVVRDFRERTAQNGHPDFEKQPAGGFGHYMNNIDMYLDADGKPVFVGGGRKVSTQWKDSANRPIFPGLYDASKGDKVGAYTGGTDSGGIASADSFSQWYRNVPNVNMSRELAITLTREPGTNLYVFDDRQDAFYQARGGFFPINNELFGNSANGSKNFHFTYELSTEFIYEPGAGQTFRFIGDDDVWVFINGKKVIDLGGVHAAIDQTVHLDRLDNLVPNKKNSLKVFQAERHRTQSNFRIETTINLKTAELPNTSKLYD